MPKVRHFEIDDEDGCYVGDIHHSYRPNGALPIDLSDDPREEQEIDNVIEYKDEILPKVKKRSKVTIQDYYKFKLTS